LYIRYDLRIKKTGVVDMADDLHDIFGLAVKHFYKKYKERGGTQDKLARRLGITQSYVSAVITGARTASLELQNQMANILYGPYEEFLMIGRRIKNGLDPELAVQLDTAEENVEGLIARLSHYVIDHQRIEKELVQSWEIFRDISLTSGDMIFVMDRDMQFTFLSGKVKEVTGRSEEEMLGRKPLDFLDEKERMRVQALADESIRDRAVLDCVISLTQDNEMKHRHLTATPVYDEKGSFDGFRGTYKDITNLLAIQKKLEEKTWLLEAAMESTEWVGLLLIDRNNHVLHYNSTYKQLFNLPPDVLEERRPERSLDHIKRLMVDPEHFMHTSREVHSRPEKFIHEFDLIDGRRIRRVVLPLFRDGELAGRHVVIYDITGEG
jgi:PAS domain S-box-containing protein